MNRAIRLLAPAVALLALTQPAAGGPIGWGYHAEVTYAQDYGSKFTVTLEPDGTVTTLPGEQSLVRLFSSNGDPELGPGQTHVYYGFTVDVTITDHASGESGTRTFTGGYLKLWGGEGGAAMIISSFGGDPDGEALELGGNRYTVRASSLGQWTFPTGEMVVQVDPTAATPEPGTLALAALGLGVVVVRRRR
jgi:hypothetical protein